MVKSISNELRDQPCAISPVTHSCGNCSFHSAIFFLRTGLWRLPSTNTSSADDEQTRWGVLYALNDEISISYQNHTSESSLSTETTDEEAEGWSASYTSGGMTFKIHRNTADNVGNATSKESEHTEIGVTFAF